MHRAWRRFLGYRAGPLALLYVAALVLIAVMAQFLPGLDPHRISDEVMRIRSARTSSAATSRPASSSARRSR